MDSIFIKHKHNNLMKYQTLIRTTATLYLLMAVLGCTGTKETEETKEVEEMVSEEFLQVDKKVISVAKTATETRFTVSSTEYWQLSKPNTGAEWITNIAADNGTSDASSITGENDTFITITTTTNPNDAERNTKLTLRAIDQAGKALTDPTPVTISFTQLGTTHTGDVSVTTQAQVNALRTSLTGTTRIVGNLTIGPKEGTSDISDLSPFASITEITGNVRVRRNPDLPNLMGLNQLQFIGGYFLVGDNASLTSLGDFSTLQSIGDGFVVGGDYDDGNFALTSLGDFTALQSIGGSFYVEGNAVPSLGDFTNLQSIGGSFHVGSNYALTSLGDFSALQSIGDSFGVVGGDLIEGDENAALTSLGDFTALQSIGSDFEVFNNALTSLGNFTALQSIGGSLNVSFNAALTFLGDFTSLQSIGGSFSVSSTALTSLGDFTALQSIGGSFVVGGSFALDAENQFGVGNYDLTSLGDFTALQSIGGSFRVNENSALTSLGGFPMLASIGEQGGFSIKVEGNDRLQDCCVLTAFLSGGTNAVSGKVFINNNATGCNSTTQVNCDPFLQVGQKIVFAAKTVAEGRLDLFSTGYWQLSKPNTGAEWITNIAAGGGNSDASSITGENHAFITITTTANPSNAGRSTTLTLRAIDQAGKALTDPVSITIPFTQLGTTHTEDITLESQADVNAFSVNATAIQGNLIIGNRNLNSDITDLRPLSGIIHVTGRVEVRSNSRLVSLGLLGNLQAIGGGFFVFSNGSLTSLGDFPVLQTIGDGFYVRENNTLTSLGDLSALESIGGWFSVYGNNALTFLEDFSTLQTIGGGFYVGDNAVLTSLGDFTALQTIGGSFSVYDNGTLTSLGGFPMIAGIGSANRIYVPSTDSEQDNVSIVVEGNNLLQDCCVLTAFLRGAKNTVSGQVFINDNATGCNNKAEMKPCAGGGNTTKGK